MARCAGRLPPRKAPEAHGAGASERLSRPLFSPAPGGDGVPRAAGARTSCWRSCSVGFSSSRRPLEQRPLLGPLEEGPGLAGHFFSPLKPFHIAKRKVVNPANVQQSSRQPGHIHCSPGQLITHSEETSPGSLSGLMLAHRQECS